MMNDDEKKRKEKKRFVAGWRVDAIMFHLTHTRNGSVMRFIWIHSASSILCIGRREADSAHEKFKNSTLH